MQKANQKWLDSKEKCNNLDSALTVWSDKEWDGLGEEIIENNLGVLVDEKLDMS